MENLLIIFESPIYKKDNEFYYEEVWFDFISKTFSNNNKVTVACYIKDEEKISKNFLKIQNKNITFVNLGKYRSFLSFILYFFTHPFKFVSTVISLIKSNNKIIVRCPSPSLFFFTTLNLMYKKKITIFLVGDVYSQSEKIVNSHFLKKIIYKILGKALIFIERISLKNVDLIYAYNSYLLLRHKSSNAKKILTLTPRYKIKDIYFRKDTCQKKKIRILRVCWLLPSKKLENLILSIKILKKNFDISLSIVGKAKDRDYNDNLIKLVNDNNLQNNVKFLGWKNSSELNEIYKNSDIQVITSEAEGIPRVMLEGFNYGLPLVSNNIVGISDRLINYKNVIFYSHDNPKEIANSITEMIVDNKTRRKIIQNNYIFSKENSIDRVSKNINDTIKKL